MVSAPKNPIGASLVNPQNKHEILEVLWGNGFGGLYIEVCLGFMRVILKFTVLMMDLPWFLSSACRSCFPIKRNWMLWWAGRRRLRWWVDTHTHTHGHNTVCPFFLTFIYVHSPCCVICVCRICFTLRPNRKQSCCTRNSWSWRTAETPCWLKTRTWALHKRRENASLNRSLPSIAYIWLFLAYSMISRDLNMTVVLLVLGERKQPGNSQHGATVCIYKPYACLFCSTLCVHLNTHSGLVSRSTTLH